MPLAIFKTCQQLFCSEVFGTPDFLKMNAEVIRIERPTTNSRLFAAYALGCHPRVGRLISSGLFLWTVFPLSACTAVVDADFGVHLLADGQCEHQRGGAQLHSQSVLPVQDC